MKAIDLIKVEPTKLRGKVVSAYFRFRVGSRSQIECHLHKDIDDRFFGQSLNFEDFTKAEREWMQGVAKKQWTKLTKSR